MSETGRPLSVTILGCLYIVVGTVSFGYHFMQIQQRHAFQYDDALVELVGFFAIVSGAFMLRGRDWARWLALAWIALHVIVSAFRGFHEFAIHGLFLALIAWFLLRPEVTRYFRRGRSEPT